MTPLEILQAGRALIEKPERWCQEDIAQDWLGAAVAATDANACKWCSIGAVRHVVGEERATELELSEMFPDAAQAFKLRRMAVENVGGYGTVWLYNDNHSHPEVLAVWDRAIELARRTQGKGTV